MGSGCCSETKEKKAPEQHENVEVFKEDYVPKKQYPNVQFDVVVPEGGDQPLEKSFSLNATMHTMRDYSIGVSGSGSGGMNNMSILDNNMSFTNNFLEVNDAVINQFTKSIVSLAKNDKFGGASILEESMRGARPLPEAPSESGLWTAEDMAYIDDGASFNEKVLRLIEVEDQTRNHIIGSWRVNYTLIQLATSRLLPTIRQRRMAWNKPVSHAVPPSAGGGHAKGSETPQKRDKIIIHAPGVDVESGMDSSVDTRPPGTTAPAAAATTKPPTATGGQNTATDFSPPNCDTPSPSASLVLDRSMLRSRAEGAAPPKVEHYEMLTLTGRDIDISKSVHSLVIHDSWDFLSKPNAADALNDGKCVFRFMCSPTNTVDDETKEMINTFINVSSFKDEERENNTPKVNIYNDEDASKYIGIFVKAMYMLPGVKLANITPAFLASLEYQKACQPGGPKLEQGATMDTFRVAITVIRFVFSLTIQFKVSEITDPQILASFKCIDGMVPAKALMLERTKRNVGKVDATAKVRSMLLYYPVNDGVLVNSQTLVLNTSLPKVVSKIVNTFGSQGASQSADTAKLTRRFLLEKFGDTRTNKK